jgi:polysaccharide biosynthesis/export protein
MLERKSMKAILMLLWSALAISSVPAAGQAMREVLGPGDTVRISDFRYPELRTEIRISQDGKANVPMIGPVKLSGMTPDEAAAHIAERLRRGNFILNPQIDVAVIEARSRQVAVLGFVKNPGRYKLEGTTAKLTDVIAMAGGLVPDASDIVVVQRSDASKTASVLRINLAEVIQHGDASKNIEVGSGDSVFVPKAPVIYVYGEVTKGGSYRLEPGMTVMQAISMAGGVTPRGSERRAKLRSRGPNGHWKEVPARALDRVSPNDVIYVPEALF